MEHQITFRPFAQDRKMGWISSAILGMLFLSVVAISTLPHSTPFYTLRVPELIQDIFNAAH